MINKEQWQEIVEGVLRFNRLVTDEQERNSEEYIIKCYNLVEAEVKEYWDEEDYTEERLKEAGDVLFTGVQLIDAITPSQLQWDCVSKYFESDFIPELKEHLLWYIIAPALDQIAQGHDLYGAMMAVNASNLSKIPFVRDGFDAVAYCKEIEEKSNGRYIGVHTDLKFDKEQNLRVIFKDSNKKVMKVPGEYFDPDLAPYMHKQ